MVVHLPFNERRFQVRSPFGGNSHDGPYHAAVHPQRGAADWFFEGRADRGRFIGTAGQKPRLDHVCGPGGHIDLKPCPSVFQLHGHLRIPSFCRRREEQNGQAPRALGPVDDHAFDIAGPVKPH
jgi:hypothetical protein